MLIREEFLPDPEPMKVTLIIIHSPLMITSLETSEYNMILEDNDIIAAVISLCFQGPSKSFEIFAKAAI